MIDAFAPIQSQPQATSYLKAALEGGKVTHAYLLVGDKTSDKEEIALRFAAALLADGDEEVFGQALGDTHPDLHVLKPQSSAGYVVEQVRDIVRDSSLAPIRSTRKVYILHDVQTMGASAANAFLKTLEEPPVDVVCILLATSTGAVLDTIKSRCEVLSLNDVGPQACEDPQLYDILYRLASGCSITELVSSAKDLVDSIALQVDGLASTQERELEKHAEFYSAAARDELAKKNKRAQASRRNEELAGRLACARTWLRDVMLVQQGAPELARLRTCSSQTLDVATSSDPGAVLAALGAVDSCERRISCNVSPQLALEAMFIEIREALCQR